MLVEEGASALRHDDPRREAERALVEHERPEPRCGSPVHGDPDLLARRVEDAKAAHRAEVLRPRSDELETCEREGQVELAPVRERARHEGVERLGPGQADGLPLRDDDEPLERERPGGESARRHGDEAAAPRTAASAEMRRGPRDARTAASTAHAQRASAVTHTRAASAAGRTTSHARLTASSHATSAAASAPAVAQRTARSREIVEAGERTTRRVNERN